MLPRVSENRGQTERFRSFHRDRDRQLCLDFQANRWPIFAPAALIDALQAACAWIVATPAITTWAPQAKQGRERNEA
jgi:hypothetical protein